MKKNFIFKCAGPSKHNSIVPSPVTCKAPKLVKDERAAIVVPIAFEDLKKDSTEYKAALALGNATILLPTAANPQELLDLKVGEFARVILASGHTKRMPVYAWLWHRENEKPLDKHKSAASLAALVSKLGERYDAISIDLSNIDDELNGLMASVDGYDVFERDVARELILSTYKYKADREPPHDVVVTFVSSRGLQPAYEKRSHQLVENDLVSSRAIAEAINYSRWLGDLPGNICTPSHLADSAVTVCGHGVHSGATVSLDRAAVNDFIDNRSKFGGVNAVAAGSDKNPEAIVITYEPATPSEAPPVVLIGKGVTFDAGGISIKPAGKMNEMKYDMCGAATVISVMQALRDLPADKAPKVKVIAVVAAAENVLGPSAVKPGDVITSYSGKTIEVLNTDAEGRLLLADMISWSQERFKPSTIIDVATLTGAVAGALDSVYAGIFSTNNDLANELIDCGEFTNDKLWRLPMHPDYDAKLKSKFADVPNIGTPGAGGSVAAHFLHRFIDPNVRWAHLDIAGVAWNSNGATGFGTYLLCDFLCGQEA